MPQTENLTTVLVVSPFEDDHAVLRRMLIDSEWNVVSVATSMDARKALHETEVDIVITECEFTDGLSWRDLLTDIENMHGSQPVIVISALADGRLWAEVLNLGGYDLLIKPLAPTEVLQVVAMAGRQARNVRQSRAGVSGHRMNMARASA